MKALLDQAMQRCGLRQAQFIQHHENAVYRADDRYLLRIHKAAEGLAVQHDPSSRQAEMALLTHLADRGLNVQRPLMFLTLDDGTDATLLTWLDGHPLSRDALTPGLLQQAGRLAWQLHTAARGFGHPSLRRYDAAHARSLADALRIMGKTYQLNPDEIRIACLAAEVIGRRLQEAEADLVAIHADLSPSNLLETPGGLAPIDFSLCGLGHPMHDLGILLGNIGSQAERQAVVQGYEAAGGQIHLPLLNAGYALGLLEALAFHAGIWPREPWFAPRLTRWVHEMLQPLAHGGWLLDQEMRLVHLPA